MSSREKVSARCRETRPTRLITVYRLQVKLSILRKVPLRKILLDIVLSLDEIKKFRGIVAKGSSAVRFEDPDSGTFIELRISNQQHAILRYSRPLSESLEPILQQIRQLLSELEKFRDILVLKLASQYQDKITLCVDSAKKQIVVVLAKVLFQKSGFSYCKSYRNLMLADVHIYQDLVHLSQLLKTIDILLTVRHGSKLLPILRLEDAWHVAKLIVNSR